MNKPLVFLHIGMRKFKSIIAVLVSFLVWQLIRLAFPSLDLHPGFAYIYAVIEIRETTEKTRIFGLRRIKGTLVGLMVGLCFIALRIYLGALLETAVPARAGIMTAAAELTLILAGVLLTLSLSQLIGCQNFCGVACAVFIVCFVWHTDGNPYFYSAMRVLQTVIGVFSAWGVNSLISPRHNQ